MAIDQPTITNVARDIPALSVRLRYYSEARIDLALLVSALFLQRFGLSAGNTSVLPLDIVVAALIFLHQFASGRLQIHFDRLLYFLAMGVAATASLLLNFKSTMLSSYGLLLVVYALCTFIRPRTSEDYKCTLQIFQFLVSILSCIAIVQFAVQFVVDGRQIISFFGVVPDSLMAGKDLANTIGPVSPGSSLIKSNGIFLGEPSTLSQVAALGIIIEVVEFRRARYLALLVLGLLLSYSGSGIIMLLVGLPLASLINRKAQLPLVVVSVFAFGLLATGMIDLSAFTDRMDEFENTQASAFIRFVSPFWMLAEHFDAASLLELLFGKGPSAEFAPRAFYYANSATWSRLIYEYGLIGTLFFTCFLGSCLRRSRCPTPAIAALLSLYLFNGQNLHSTWLVIVIVVLCTLNLPDLRRGRINETRSRSSSFLESRIA